MPAAKQFELREVIGVDFSGARHAGELIWLARCVRSGDERPWRLAGLDCLADLAGTPLREPALAFLVERIRHSAGTLWAMDFPMGLPIELFTPGTSWAEQLAEVLRWPGSASELGREFVRRARALGGPMHIRRMTDRDTKTPFDCYHYRIIYQTFFGMRCVLGPLSCEPKTAIMPFQFRRLTRADRVVVEACPSSTLKRLGLPYQRYKQPTRPRADRAARAVRRTILQAFEHMIKIAPADRERMLADPGGDALDSVVAAMGAVHAWERTDRHAVARHARYPAEGYIYA